MSDKKQIVNNPNLYVNGFGLEWSGLYSLTVNPGICRDETNDIDMSLDEAVILRTDLVGIPNGLDEGAVAANTWYAVYLISDSNKYQPTATIASLSLTNPKFPAGYDTKLKIGWLHTNGVGELLPIKQTGNGKYREYWMDSTIEVLAAGHADTFTEIDLSAAMPPIDNSGIFFHVSFTADTGGNAAEFRAFGSSATQVQAISALNGIAQQLQIKHLAVLDSGVPKIEYKVTAVGDTLNLKLLAFTDHI